ncbi:MAG: type III secretion inner membrane ring lipoprotein SctJ [Puniceicoccales bacterium]|jgi:type III secretion protein J|nr:type III secretion inner membrane ring lipoprotein SctJ [Puniceicoccales bacterium]
MKKSNFNSGFGVFALAFVLLLLTGCGKVELLSNLPEKDANQVVSIMQQHRIQVAKRAGVEMTWTIDLKNSSDFSRAVKVLESMGYPATQYNTIGQVFQKSGLVSSPLEERARLVYALSETIADTLNKIPGVLSARVHIVLPENDPYSDSDVESSAAIFLTYKAGSNLDESVREIKYLVANSVQGLDYDRVSIAMFPIVSDVETQTNNVFDSNVSVLGLSMASDAAEKFVIILVILVVLLLSVAGVAIFFFISARRAKATSGSAVAPKSNGPVVVQSDEQSASDLDEEPEESNEKSEKDETSEEAEEPDGEDQPPKK